MQQKSRMAYTLKNLKWGYICTFISYLVSFPAKTVLVWTMGADYTGVNGLFNNILGVLSFADLGIGAAFNFSLYKPVAENDVEKLKAIMRLYKQVYRIIAAVIAILGTMLVPFLHYLVNAPQEIKNIEIYYIVFLFHTVTSYFVSYKYSIVNARQENYVFSILNTISKVAVSTVQIIILIYVRDYLSYLLVGAVIGLLEKIWVSIYLDKKYPLLADKNIQPLEKAEKDKIWKNTRALIWHKIGEISVHQTDNIIISVFVNIATVGKITYYTYIIDAFLQVLRVTMGSVVGSFGNVVSTESSEQQYKLFKSYRFAAFWMYGYLAIGLCTLVSKFVKIVAGRDMLLPDSVVMLIVLNFYMTGHRYAVDNVKAAAGIFRQDKFVALLQAFVNLVVSITLVRFVGLPGVYIGTLVQGTLATVIKPIIMYRIMFNISAVEYFVSGIKYLLAVIVAGGICVGFDRYLFCNDTWFIFVFEVIFFSIIINLFFVVVFHKTEEFLYFWNLIKKTILKKMKEKIG